MRLRFILTPIAYIAFFLCVIFVVARGAWCIWDTIKKKRS